MQRRHGKSRKKLKEGSRVEIQCLDHTSNDSEGWQDAKGAMKCTPVEITLRGFYVGETPRHYTIAMGKAKEGGYSTLFNVIKGTIIRLSSHK